MSHWNLIESMIFVLSIHLTRFGRWSHIIIGFMNTYISSAPHPKFKLGVALKKSLCAAACRKIFYPPLRGSVGVLASCPPLNTRLRKRKCCDLLFLLYFYIYFFIDNIIRVHITNCSLPFLNIIILNEKVWKVYNWSRYFLHHHKSKLKLFSAGKHRLDQ